MREPRVFSIPAGTPFLPTLAEALLDGTLTGGWPEGAGLADATIYLPTRRAGRAFAAHLTERAGGRALLLPRIVPLGDVDEDLFEPGEAGPPTIPTTERRLILAKLVQAWAANLEAGGARVASPDAAADAVALAADLAALMDSLATEGVDWDALAGAVEVDHSAYFASTLSFVRIAHEHWPQILAERGASDPARRRHDALLAEAERLAAGPANAPIIAAGSTGSVPATAQLLAAIARLPHGALVLPGLDTELDEAAWRSIGGRPKTEDPEAGPLWGHPQCMMRRFLADPLRIERTSVRILGPTLEHTHPVAARRLMLSEVMRPAETTDTWASLPVVRGIISKAGCEKLTLLEAADEREEALAIALALRETLEEPSRTAALVTPDRALARRVAVEMRRWGVEVEDSAGSPLAETPGGRLARLAAEAVAFDFQPLAVLALLAHPAVTLGLSRDEIEAASSALEIGVLRGPAPGPGLAGIEAALGLQSGKKGRGRDPLPRRNLSERAWRAAEDLLARLAQAFAGFMDEGRYGALDPSGSGAPSTALRAVPLPRFTGEEPGSRVGSSPAERGRGTMRSMVEGAPARLPGHDMVGLPTLAEPHADTLLALTAGNSDLTDRSYGEVLELLDELSLMPADAAVRGRLRDYPAFFTTLARERVLAPDVSGGHRRVKILGLLEARLLEVDRIVLGALDESIWPPTAESDAFLSRPMRLRLGLSPPERRIGQTAHDFVQALGTSDAILSRSRKRDAKPTVPSRFLERLRAFIGPEAWDGLAARGNRYIRLAEQIDRPAIEPPATRPSPKPGPERFPRSLSVTEIETLVRDPYSIFARHILKLSPLDPIGQPPNAAERGTILHGILADFAQKHPEALPATALQELHQLGLDGFAGLERAYPELHALWWPDFQRIVPSLLAWEAERRGDFAGRVVERDGRLVIPLGGEDAFTVRARADRIEQSQDGAAAIVDFKSGTVPSNKAIWAGFSPQLTLEAAMLMAGGFPDAAATATPELLYVKLGGRARVKSIDVGPPKDSKSLAALIEAHAAGLAVLARRFAIEGAGYLSRPYPQYALKYSDYDHLARVAEWSVLDDDEAAP